MRSIIKWIILLAILGGIGWAALKWYRIQEVSVDAFSLIPSDAIYCIVTSRPIESWKEISGSNVWTHLQQNAYFAELTASANSLDSLIRDNDVLFDLIGSRALMVSAHMTGSKEYDFLFLTELSEASGIQFIKEYLNTFSAAGYSFRKEKYGDDDIIALQNLSDNSILFLSLTSNYLVASYTRKIITDALDYYHSNSQATREFFIRQEADLDNTGVVQVYMNYTKLPQFMSSYSDGSNEYVRRLSQTLQSSTLSFTVDNELISATGHTYVNDSVESYLKTLSLSGKAPSEITAIAPVRTAFFLGLGFSTFQQFFENFKKNLQQDVSEYKSYEENLLQMEKFLHIKLQENIINWIGDEVAILELQSSGKGLDNETALILKADNIEAARKNLIHIEKMIRRRTPVKFKTVDHKGYTINYLHMKGLFKILLGKFFARYDKPYYTIVNNFVIFSNHPQTLKSIIDDYLNKNTLSRSDEFRDFRKKFEDESSVLVYLNTPVLFNTMKKLADASTRASMENNKEYIVCFRQVAFQLVPEEGGFKTFLAEQFVAPQPVIKPEPAFADIGVEFDSVVENDVEVIDNATSTDDVDPMELPYIYAKNLNASSYTEYFPDSVVHFRVELKNGFKDGEFVEYYESGEVKMKGRFKRDKRDGTWRLFSEKGDLVMKRNYNNDDVTKEKIKE
jgi:hypothetical protein